MFGDGGILIKVMKLKSTADVDRRQFSNSLVELRQFLLVLFVANASVSVQML